MLVQGLLFDLEGFVDIDRGVHGLDLELVQANIFEHLLFMLQLQMSIYCTNLRASAACRGRCNSCSS